MGYVLSLPVRKSELINAMLSRAGVEQMATEEQRLTAQRVQEAVCLIMLLIPDYLKINQIRTR